MTTVKEIMESRVVSVNTATPIVEVARLMKVMRTGVVAVCDNGKLQGMITQRDLVNILATAGEPLKESAGSMMNKNCPIISPNDDILRAADVMVEKGVHVLPVVFNGKLLGLFSMDNLAQKSRGVAAVAFCKSIKLQTSQEVPAKDKLSFAEVR